MSIKLHLKSPLWQNKLDGAIRQRGTCWQLLNTVLEAKSPEQVGQALQTQNGFYALVWQQRDRTYAAVDHIRSIPLFYALKDQTFFLSDEAEWVREQVGNTKMDPLARDEFQLAGYVTGQDTLFPDVKQLQAGELLVVDEKNGLPELATERYYRFLHTEPESYSEADLYQQLDKAALASIDNLIRYANGRQIVIPLSGGYDSRLIATLLKRRGYDNILTFTYGVPGNKESAYSKKVADALGLQWHFVEYSDELWRNAWQAEERWQYQKWASGWSSLPHVQDWLAVKILKDEEIVEHDCVFAPGHCCVTALIPEEVFDKKKLSKKLYKEKILAAHFNLAPPKLFEIYQNHQALNFLDKFTPEVENVEINEFVRYFMEFGWQERQAKFIGNSIRVYEFFGYDWWMPLWDIDFARFWHAIPVELRGRRGWYVDYVSGLFIKYADSPVGNLNNAAEGSSLVAILKTLPILRNALVKKLAKKILKPKDVMGRGSRFPADKHKVLREKGFSLNGVNAYFFISDASKGFSPYEDS